MEVLEIGALIGRNWGAIWGVLGGLFVFGFLFNIFVARMNKEGYSDGLLWLWVVIGTAVTVISSGFLIGWGSVLIVFLCFVSSGFWMVVGDIYRTKAAERQEAREWTDGNETA